MRNCLKYKTWEGSPKDSSLNSSEGIYYICILNSDFYHDICKYLQRLSWYIAVFRICKEWITSNWWLWVINSYSYHGVDRDVSICKVSNN